MKCVVLLGFSTTGKSSILSHFRKEDAHHVDTLDSDQQISQSDDGHIYNVYLRYRNGSNTETAIRAIDRREREFLRTTRPTRMPLLLASGPFLPLREPEWSEFIAAVSPVFFYLQKNPEDVLNGLLERRKRQLAEPELSNRPGFGCWDQGVTTNYQDGQWVEISRARALENIRRNMEGMVAKYSKLATYTFSWNDRQTPGGQERLLTAIRSALGIES